MRNRPSPGSADRLYRPDIDAIRAVAILSVVLYHAGVPFISGGFSGVDIFFVISGYLIGGHIFQELLNGSFSYLRFYQRRAKRILPAFYCVLAFILLAGLILLLPIELEVDARSAIAATLSASNILFWKSGSYFNPDVTLNPLLMTWSLGIEEQFYFVIPLLMVLLTRIRRSWLLPAILVGCLISFLFACVQLQRLPLFVFYMLPARAWELGAGVALAAAELEWKRSLIPARLCNLVSLVGLVLMLAPVFVISSVTPFPGAAALPSVLGTVLVIASANSWINRRALSLRPLTFIGRISYSWYLWHWPLLALARVIGSGNLPLPVAACAVATAFVAAVLSYYFIEQPFRRSRTAPGVLLTRYAVVSIAALALCTIIWAGKGLPARFPAAAGMDAAGGNADENPCAADYGVNAPNLSSDCYSVLGNQPSVVLLGDSHALKVAPLLHAKANAQGYGFAILSKLGCLPLKGAARYRSGGIGGGPGECFEFNDKILQVIERDSRIRIVVLAAYWASPFYRGGNEGWLISDPKHPTQIPTLDATRSLFVRSLSDFIRSIQASGKRVIVLEDVPSFDFDPVLHMRSAAIPARHALETLLAGHNEIASGWAYPSDNAATRASASAVKQVVDSLPGAEFVAMRSRLCNSQGLCAYLENGLLLYGDTNHITYDGARIALQGFSYPPLASGDK